MRLGAMASVGNSLSFALRLTRQMLSRRLFAAVAAQRVAVVLSGCGVYDGSEVHEASACWVHLSRAGSEVTFYAPDIDQMHVVDHCTGQPVETDKRNVLTESARIARGAISPLSQLSESSYDALVFPGGFGVAKNLSTYVLDGAGMTVNPEVQQAINNFHAAKKPIGLCCISPILAAKLLSGCSVTVGHDAEEDGKWPYAGTAAAVQTMGARHVVKDLNEALVDEENLVVTTPAFMCNAKVHEVYDSVGAMITALVGLLRK